MREILYRGKTAQGEWVYGFLAQYNIIMTDMEDGFKLIISTVLPETVGQYVPLEDDKGTKIFEGDVVTGERWSGDVVRGCTEICGIVSEDQGAMWVVSRENLRAGWHLPCLVSEISNRKVIGNIHDNIELLRGDK